MDQKKIGKFIQDTRKKQNLTQEELAEKLGVSNRSVSRWECGRNMPDVSLYKPLCEILNITVNDLVRGEVITQEEYKQKTEENVINVMEKVNNLQKKKKILISIIILIIGLIIVFLLCLTLPSEIGNTLRYDNRVITCEFNDTQFIYKVNGINVVDSDFVEKNLNGEKLYFFTSKVTLNNKINSHWQSWESMAELLNGGKTKFSAQYIMEYEKKDTIKIYYTDISLKKIKKANDVELAKIIKNSNLMCQNG